MTNNITNQNTVNSTNNVNNANNDESTTYTSPAFLFAKLQLNQAEKCREQSEKYMDLVNAYKKFMENSDDYIKSTDYSYRKKVTLITSENKDKLRYFITFVEQLNGCLPENEQITIPQQHGSPAFYYMNDLDICAEKCRAICTKYAYGRNLDLTEVINSYSSCLDDIDKITDVRASETLQRISYSLIDACKAMGIELPEIIAIKDGQYTNKFLNPGDIDILRDQLKTIVTDYDQIIQENMTQSQNFLGQYNSFCDGASTAFSSMNQAASSVAKNL